MAKSKIDKDDIKRLVENISNPSSTTSVYSAKYVEDNFLKEITKEAIEEVLTGVITSHDHNYTTSTDVSDLINTAIASVYKPKGNIADKTALLALTNIKQGDVYNAQSTFTLNGQNVKVGDNIVCLSDAATSSETNWDNLGGNIDFAAALSQALVGFSATSGSISSSNTILEAINMLAYDKHTHSNKAILDAIQVALTNTLKTNYDAAYTHSQSTHAPINALTNRTIKVNGVDKAGSATTIPLNFVSTDGISVYGYVNQGILDILFSSNSLLFMGELADVITPSTPSFQYDNLLNGIYDIVPENTYEDVPNVSCGTDESKSGMKGSLVSQLNGAGKSLVYHCFNTNNIYICSGTIDDTTGNITWSNWKRLLTCEDKPQTIQADTEAESIYHLPIPATGTTDYTFYLNGFDGKNGNKIEIDLGTIAGSVNMNKRVVEIYVSPAQPNIDVSFYCAGLNSFTPTASYTDPLLVSGNIYYMKFIFLKQTTYWSVDNNIAYF